MMAGPDVFLGPTPEFPAIMTTQLTSMRDSSTLTDFTITATTFEPKLPCHKVVLAIHSPYLAAMFTTDMVEAAKNTVHFRDITPKTMKLILDYCYSEQIGFPSDQFMPLIMASDYLQIERLTKRCINKVQDFLTPDNVLNYLTFAVEKPLKGMHYIMSWCLDIIAEKFSEVAKQPAFMALSYDVLEECVKEMARSDAKHDEVLNAVFEWVNYNAESRGKHLEALKWIKLGKCSLSAILAVMMTHEVMIANCKVLELLKTSVNSRTAKIVKPAILNPQNVLQYLTFACKHNLQDIKTYCLEVIIAEKFTEVAKQPAFMALSYDVLEECVKEMARSDAKHDEVLNAIFEWVNYDAESHGKHLEALKWIKLEKCSLSAILAFMMTHEVMIANCKVLELLKTSVKSLTAKIVKPARPANAKTFLNPQNVLQYLTFARKHNLQDIKNWCLDFVVTSLPEVFKQEAFHSLTYAEVLDWTTQVAQSYVESDDALLAVFKWVNEDAKSREQHLDELLQKVDLDNCSMLTIHDVIGTHYRLIESNARVFRQLIQVVKKLNQPTRKMLVIVGGELGCEKCWSVDTKANKITEAFSITFKERGKYYSKTLLSDYSVCQSPGGFVLTGGIGSNMCVAFVASTKSWREMPKMMSQRSDHGSIYIKGILYVVCGYISGNLSTSLDCLILASGQWKSLPKSPESATYPKLAELNGKLYMLGKYSKKLYEFDVAKEKWKARASLPIAGSSNSYGLSMVAVNGQLCVAGGSERICAWYNPGTDIWSKSDQKPSKNHINGSLVQVDATTLLFLGGRWKGEIIYIEELNIEDGSWSVKEYKMPENLRLLKKAMFLDIPHQD